jgi:2-succinyl-6-hydroxy-2,4-cyclohexadiene-1-carboxylate synthase
VLVALHGFTGGGGDFAPLAEALREWHWVTPDLPGHASDPTLVAAPSDDCTLNSSLEFLDSLIPEMAKDPTILLGYSLGGRLALNYALERPGRVAAIILIGASPGILDRFERDKRRSEDESLAKKILADGVQVFLNDWQQRPLIATQSRLPMTWQTTMRARREKLRPAGLAASLRGFGQGSIEPVWHRLGELRIPALICAGAEDEKYSLLAKKMAAGLSESELLILPKAGHMAHLENLPGFVTGVRAFLAQHHLQTKLR